MATSKPPSDKPAARKVSASNGSASAGSVPKRSAANRKPGHDAIARRAHEIYEAEGGGTPTPNGCRPSASSQRRSS